MLRPFENNQWCDFYRCSRNRFHYRTGKSISILFKMFWSSSSSANPFLFLFFSQNETLFIKIPRILSLNSVFGYDGSKLRKLIYIFPNAIENSVIIPLKSDPQQYPSFLHSLGLVLVVDWVYNRTSDCVSETDRSNYTPNIWLDLFRFRSQIIQIIFIWPAIPIRHK